MYKNITKEQKIKILQDVTEYRFRENKHPNTDFWLQKIDEIIEERNKELVDEIEKGAETQEPTGCPDNITGCCVYHFRNVKRDLTIKEIIALISNKDE